MFKFVDRETGRLLALRADITPQIARVVATRLRDEPKPVRLAYVASVFRDDSSPMARSRELHQAGVELIGLEKPEAEVEIIAMAIEGLRALGLHRFQIDLGHPRLLPRAWPRRRGPMPSSSASCAGPSRARTPPPWSAWSTTLAAAGPRAATALLALPALVGHEETLERAATLACGERASPAPCQNLSEVYRLLTIYGLADAVLFDLGEVRGFDYYSGLHFEAYVSGLRRLGGRRRPLRPDAGPLRLRRARPWASPSTWAASWRSWRRKEWRWPWRVPTSSSSISPARRRRRCRWPAGLRDLGASVARDIVSRGLDESLAYARAQRVRRVLVVGSPRTRRRLAARHRAGQRARSASWT